MAEAYGKDSGLVKPLPDTDFTVPAGGGGTNAETRLNRLAGYITPNHRFYVRSHSPTPYVDASKWRLRLEGPAVQQALALGYEDLSAMPQVSLIRAIECAGNGRTFFETDFGRSADGAQWGRGAIGVAEWTGVRLRDVLKQARITTHAHDVLPEGLDESRYARPLPVQKALADDTLIALAMNGEALPADHGFPARLVVPGWLGAASVKWLGRIVVSNKPEYTHWNTKDYTLAGPAYPAVGPADGVPVRTMPVMSITEMEWNAQLYAGGQTVRGRAFSGEGRVATVQYRIDDGAWNEAALEQPNITAAWVRWAFRWQALPGAHVLRVRAIDEYGNAQPHQVPWNDHGCLYNAVVAHPFTVV